MLLLSNLKKPMPNSSTSRSTVASRCLRAAGAAQVEQVAIVLGDSLAVAGEEGVVG